MDVLDGFIVGIYNYCDRWCETCAFTSHCRVFADRAAFETTLDAHLKPMIEARPLVREGVAPDHESIDLRARAYSFGTAGWLQKVETPGHRACADPRAILAHDCALIPAKVYRALNRWLLSREAPEDWPADQDGSAKVALLSIDRSRAAWIATAERGLAPATEIEPFVSALGVLADELERLFPHARAFVRPGFDEPAEVAKLTE